MHECGARRAAEVEVATHVINGQDKDADRVQAVSTLSTAEGLVVARGHFGCGADWSAQRYVYRAEAHGGRCRVLVAGESPALRSAGADRKPSGGCGSGGDACGNPLAGNGPDARDFFSTGSIVFRAGQIGTRRIPILEMPLSDEAQYRGREEAEGWGLRTDPAVALSAISGLSRCLR